ncbi:MAG: hypothetical protein HKN15_08930 [Xanthomonadales bacterium]|nr:hypothetical protein [Xanthomonadales bacterium]
MTEFSARPIDGTRPVGVSLLAMMALLVALLALMLSFSLWLRMQISDTFTADIGLIAGLFLFAQAYALQAWVLWTLRRWARMYTLALLMLVTLAGLAEAARNELLALGTMLVFGLGFVTGIVALLVVHPPATRALFNR